MGKRLISLNKRADTIIDDIKAQGDNISAYVSEAIIDEMLPVYSELRVEALYILDIVSDGAQDWTGQKLVIHGISDPTKNIDFIIKQSLSRGIVWLMRNHHIKNGDVLRNIIERYHTSRWNGGVNENKINDFVSEQIQKIKDKLKEIDENYQDYNLGFGALARDVLDHWDSLWNDADAYGVLASCVQCENPIKPIDALDAIRMLQWIENQFIVEAIGEKTK